MALQIIVGQSPPPPPPPSQPEDAAATRYSSWAGGGHLCYLLNSSYAAALPPGLISMLQALSRSPVAGVSLRLQLDCMCSEFVCLLQHLLHLSAPWRSYRRVIRSLPSFWVMLFYFLSASFLGFLCLKIFHPAAGTPRVPGDFDLFFMAVSAVTVSSMSTAEIGALSAGQLFVLAVLMLVGGEVFASMVELHLMEIKRVEEITTPKVSAFKSDPAPQLSRPDDITAAAMSTDFSNSNLILELGSAAPPATSGILKQLPAATDNEQRLRKKHESFKILGAVVFVYFVLAHLAGSLAIFLYFIVNPDPRALLAERGVSILGFSVFMAISSFANAGFVPLNEGMAPFKQSPGVLLLIVPLVLSGNTLFPSLLRCAVWLSKAAVGGELSEYILENCTVIRFQHLLSNRHSSCLLFTVMGFICVQTVVFCWVEWGGMALRGLSTYQKVVGGLYMAVNSRHAGESPFDLSAISSAVLVLYVVMMYLPPYTSFVPAGAVSADDGGDGGEDDGGGAEDEKRGRGEAGEKVERWKLVLGAVMRSLSVSHLSFLAICVMLVCITERRKLTGDPLNFNVFHIVVEVTSAYGNVGYSTGYSCARRLPKARDGPGECTDAWYGFVGWWSCGGKLVLIVVMFFGRLKKYTMGTGGRAWLLT